MLKKVKVHRPAECRCPNCCNTVLDRNHALWEQKQRILGIGRFHSQERKPWPAYKQRQFEKLHPNPFRSKKPWRPKKFWRWKTQSWYALRAIRAKLATS